MENDRPTLEIEITEEMIERAADVLRWAVLSAEPLNDLSEVVRDVLRAVLGPEADLRFD